MSCASQVQPLHFTFENVTLTTDGKSMSNGIALQFGTPPQLFAITPVTLLNNTFVNNIASCGSDANTTCISVIGGGFDPGASSTFKGTTADSWNGSGEAAGGFTGTPEQYFNDVLTVDSTELPGFPLLIQSTGANIYAGLGLGSNSTFINRLVEANLAPSRSWSLFPGVYSKSGAGSLIIGGYADRFYEGSLYTKNLSAPDVPRFEIASIIYEHANGTYDLLPSGNTSVFKAVVDSYYPTMTVPDDMLWKWGNATNGTWSATDLLHTYAPNKVPTGNITVTLANGLKTTIPNKALFDPPAYDNGLLQEERNRSSTVFSVFTSWAAFDDQDPGDVALFGMPYAAYVYLIRDYEREQISIANANQAAQISGNATTICAKTSEGRNSSSGHKHTGAIVGGVVGGIVGLALGFVLAWFLLRRRKNNDKSGTTRTDTKDVAEKAELPHYNAVDGTSKVKKEDAPLPASAQEMSAQQPRTELQGEQHQPPEELPAKNSGVRAELPTEAKEFRSELPA